MANRKLLYFLDFFKRLLSFQKQMNMSQNAQQRHCGRELKAFLKHDVKEALELHLSLE